MLSEGNLHCIKSTLVWFDDATHCLQPWGKLWMFCKHSFCLVSGCLWYQTVASSLPVLCNVYEISQRDTVTDQIFLASVGLPNFFHET